MPERVLIRLQPDATLAWIGLDAGGRPLSGANAGAPPPETLARTQKIVAIVPAEAVLLIDAPVVSAQRSQLARAIPFAIEDQLASPVEDLHFALPERISGERIPVAVVAKAAMRAWIATLAEHGIRPDAIVPESLALPFEGDAATLLIEGARAVLRTGAASGSACAIESLPDWLRLHGVANVEVFDFRIAPALALPATVTRYHVHQRDPLALIATGSRAAPALDLLQGEFAASHRAMPAARLWRRAAVLVAAALILAFADAGGDWWRLRAASERLDVAERDVLHTAFPELDRVGGDPRQLMDSSLARLRGGGDAGGLLDVLARIGQVLASSARVTVKSIEYHNATLELGLRAPDVATLDLVRERVANIGGLKAEITSSTSGSDGVEGRLRIGGGRP